MAFGRLDDLGWPASFWDGAVRHAAERLLRSPRCTDSVAGVDTTSNTKAPQRRQAAEDTVSANGTFLDIVGRIKEQRRVAVEMHCKAAVAFAYDAEKETIMMQLAETTKITR